MADIVRDLGDVRHEIADKCKVCCVAVNLKLCAQCKKVAYCTKNHQKQDWKVHKAVCRKLAGDNVAETSDNKRSSKHTDMANVTQQLDGLSIDSQSELSGVTSNISERVNEQKKQHTYSSENSTAMPMYSMNKPSKARHDVSSTQASDINVRKAQERKENSESNCYSEAVSATDCTSKTFTTSVDSILAKHSSTSKSEPSLPVDETIGSAEKFILESTETSLIVPNYKMKNESRPKSKMPYQTVVESRNKALGEYVMKCLNAFGVCVIDNFLGDSKGTDILSEVQDLYEGGDLSSGQLVNTTSPRGSVRGDVITWVDGSEISCVNVNFLITSIDAIMLHCQNALEQYTIKGRSKAMVAVYPGNAAHFLRHVDNPSGDGRCVTCIYYLNKNWNSKIDGGLLRIFPEGENRVANVEPKFDRLLFFWSDRRNPHEVLPAFRHRYAITVWYYDEQERRRAVKRFKGKADMKTKEMVPLQGFTDKNFD